jgi:YCII-related domain
VLHRVLLCGASFLEIQNGRSKEFLAGFGIIDVPNLDAALEWAARHPLASRFSVEVRPLLGSHFVVGGTKTS